MDMQEYFAQLEKQIDQVFGKHPEIFDHREDYPWLTGSLGNPFSGLWFVAENPSLSRVERFADRENDLVTEEAQWSESPGDKLFRKMLVKHRFKEGDLFSPGGWKCYITNVIKETDYVKNWRAKSQLEREKVAEIWFPVLEWELSNSGPMLVVAVGRQAQKLLGHLSRMKNLDLPRTEAIPHYSYIGSRAQGKLGPMHPERVAQYDSEFARISEIFRLVSMGP